MPDEFESTPNTLFTKQIDCWASSESAPSREKNMVDHLQTLAYWGAQQKGWDDPLSEAKSFGDWCSLMHSEISEAYEDYREHHKLNEIYYEFQGETTSTTTYGEKLTEQEMWDMINTDGYDRSLFKPCGIPIEMADEVIRILHLAAFAGFNLYNMIEMKMDYNQRRSHRHGGKKT